MYKALFINPPDVFSNVFPAGLSIIISIAKENGLDVTLCDLNNKVYSEQLRNSTISEIEEFQPDLIGYTGFSTNFGFIQDMSKAIASRLPNTLQVGGGYWCRWSPEFSLKHTNLDVIVNGEGEKTFDDLLKSFDSY